MFPQITPQEQEELRRLAKKIRLKEEIEQLDSEIESYRVRAEVEDKNFSQELDSLQKRKQVLEEENEEIDEREFPFFKLRAEVEVHLSRLKKLETKRSSISEKVYTSLLTEYTESYQKVQRTLNDEERRLRELMSSARTFLETVDETIEETRIRGDLGEIPESESATKLTELENKRSQAQTLLKAMDKVLDKLAV